MGKPTDTQGSPLNKPGFHLLKAGKSIAGTPWNREKDVTIFEDGKKSTLKNITKKSYVSNVEIKKMGVNLKHFEDKVFESIPAID